MPGIAQLVTILFLLIALAAVVYTFFPTLDWPPVLSIRRIVYLIVGLIVLYIIYLIVMAILGTAGVAHAAAAGLVFAGLTPAAHDLAAAPDPNHDQAYINRWRLMVAGWILGLIGGAIGIMEKIGWAALGINDITANWLLVVSGVAVLVSGALATFPTAPDAARLRAERALHYERKAAKRVRLTE